MSDSLERGFQLPSEQQAIRDKCFHPSGTFVEFPIEDVETSIPARFEKIVRRYPDRLAVKMGDRSLTYAELDCAANRIARAILAIRGPGSEPIALLFEHGIDVVAVILGVLKAGKFYVVFDLSFPLARISNMLDDSQAGLLVANKRSVELAHRLTTGARTLLNVDEIDELLGYDNLNLPISADNLGSILYTSGSTGKPKGVVHSHRSQLHTVMVNTNENCICCHDRLTLLHSVGFGSAQAHLFQSLLNGAALCCFNLKSEGIHRLAKWLKEESITVYHSSPAVFRQLAEGIPDEEKLASLRLIRLSGAPVNRLDFDVYAKKFTPGALLQTVMNSTEANVICSLVTDGSFCFPEFGSPAGFSVPGKQILLLDDDGAEVGLGELGEIAVKSRFLPPGYWDNLEINGIKFGSGPSGADERLCLTGDLGRMLPDGFLIHLGRKDFMVKIRGYRVEIGEIERALLAHPLIKDAGVVAWEREVEEKYLAAYVVPRTNPVPRIDELRAFLSDKLPDYMIPLVFVFLESLPLTNGKLDRTVLPKPEGKRPELSQSYVTPRSEVERDLVRIWEEVLDVRPIGIHDNFLDLGGHSLAATRILSRVVRTFKVSLSLTQLFQTSTVVGMAGHIAEQPSITGIRATFDLVKKRQEIESCPLSLTQQRLWFLHQLEPESCAYNLLSVTRLTGRLDVTALKQSLDKVIERHEVLRTIFRDHDGNAQQVILPLVAIDLTVVDLRQIANGGSIEAKVSALAVEFAQIHFDLARGPLLRVKLLRLGEDQFVLLHVVHHIVYDAWSIGIFVRDVSRFYNAIVKGETPDVEPLSIQFGDFAVWQHERFQESQIQDDLEYWKRQLADLTTLQMPTDHPRPSIQTHRGGKKSFILNEALTAAIKTLSRNENATLFMTLLAAFQTLLHRYTSQDDIVVGTAVDGRPQLETEEVIGFFLNTLVLRSQFSGNPTFRRLLERVREVCLGAFNHRNFPFDKLVEELHPERNLSYNPLFRVGFVFQNSPEFTWQLSGVAAQKWELESGTAHFDLHLFMEEEGQTLKGSVIFNADLFDAETISRLLDHFNVLLEGIVADPEQPVSELPLLTDAERRQILEVWNDTKSEYPIDRCVHQWFEEQVEKTPGTIAVAFEDRQLTYRELNNQANQLAHYLRKLGVGPEVLVGICVERCIEMIIGLLGILKAGGACVPLDPSYPKERLAFMLQDSGAPVLITQQAFVDVFINDTVKHTGKIISLDTDWEKVGQGSESNVTAETPSDSLAYVIYTSGSTGHPKGIAVSHRAVNRLVINTDYVQVTPSDVMAQASNVSFDAATFEIWGALLNGARLVLIGKDTLLSPQSFSTAIERHAITTVFLTTALFNQMVEQIPAALGKLRCLLFGGEAVDTERVKELLRTGPPRRLLHVYGPTETTTFASWYRVKAVAAHATTVPIGRPIANTQIFVLDKHLAPVPIGVVGEIYIGGDGLARGYLNQPELTAEKFLYHSFGGEAARRLYKTGDLGRYLPDGNIEFVGRIDNQVKLRGYRIELGEIEAVLTQIPAIQNSVVVVQEDTAGDKRLVAYVVAAQDSAPSTNELRTFLQQKLPDYMVPSVFVFLDALPLTPNGKVDRRALPVPKQAKPELKQNFVTPRSPVEERLAVIWAQVLGVKQVGVTDNFFDVGGHSLLAVRLFAAIEKEFKKRLLLSSLFQGATIEHLASIISQPAPFNGSSAIVAIQPQGSKRPFFCVHEFFGDVLCYFNLARHLGQDQPFYAIEARGLDGVEEPFTDIKTMAAHYIEQIRTVQPVGPYALGGLCFGGLVAFEMAQQLRAKGEAIALVALLDSGVNSNRGRGAWWWSFLRNLPRDFPSWLIGSLQLNRAQWASLIRQRIRMTQATLREAFRSSAEGSHQDDAPLRIENLGDFFQFSEQHRKVARAQYRALRQYRPRTYTGHLTLFRARMQPFFSSHEPEKGWGQLAVGGLEIRVVPGNHLGMLQEPHVRVLAQQLRDCLNKAQTEAECTRLPA